MSLPKILFLLVLATGWLYAAPWIHKDSQQVRAPRNLWSSVYLTVGTVTLLFWLVLPYYVVGLLLFLLGVLTTLLSYLAYRNARVHEEKRIHLTTLFGRRQTKSQEQIVTRVKIYRSDGKILVPPTEDSTEENPIHAYNLTQELLYDMIWRRASECDMSPEDEQTRMRYIIDGVPVKRSPLSVGESEAIIQYLKPLGSMNAEDRRRPQKGYISVDMGGNQIDINLAVAGTNNGQRMRLRIVQQYVQTRLDELGIAPDLLAWLRQLSKSDKGLFIVSGRPGSGITSTLYSLLREQDAFIKQLVTLEAKVEVDMENITQYAYEEASKLPQALASTMRRDPDVIMIDRCSDSATAELILQFAEEKCILLGMHASDSFTALARWAKVSGQTAQFVAPLRGVLCQQLVRKLCPQCREPYKPDPQLLAKANIPAESVDMFYRPKGNLLDEKGQPYTCPTCQGSGYFERIAAFELLEMNQELKDAIQSGASLSQLKAAARKNRMLYLQEQALQKVIAGETSIQEILRVSQQPKKKET